MRRGEQWQVGQPAWAVWLGAAAGCIAAAALAYGLFPFTVSLPASLRVPFSILLAVLVALLAVRLNRSRRVTGTLYRSESGSWHFQCGVHSTALQPVHAWTSAGWIMLRARVQQRDLRLTLWKSAIPPDDWRRLRAHVVRLAAMPAKVLGKESE